MASDAERLVKFYEAAMPRMENAWRRSWKRGYDARVAGKSRFVHARGGNKGMWLRGWDKADRDEGTAE